MADSVNVLKVPRARPTGKVVALGVAMDHGLPGMHIVMDHSDAMRAAAALYDKSVELTPIGQIEALEETAESAVQGQQDAVARADTAEALVATLRTDVARLADERATLNATIVELRAAHDKAIENRIDAEERAQVSQGRSIANFALAVEASADRAALLGAAKLLLGEIKWLPLPSQRERVEALAAATAGIEARARAPDDNAEIAAARAEIAEARAKAPRDPEAPPFLRDHSEVAAAEEIRLADGPPPPPAPHRFRTGDIVIHVPSGEKWVLAYADYETGYAAAAGWPDGETPLSALALRAAASDAEHAAAVNSWLQPDSAHDRRSEVIRRLYPDFVVTPLAARPATPEAAEG